MCTQSAQCHRGPGDLGGPAWFGHSVDVRVCAAGAAAARRAGPPVPAAAAAVAARAGGPVPHSYAHTHAAGAVAACSPTADARHAAALASCASAPGPGTAVALRRRPPPPPAGSGTGTGARALAAGFRSRVALCAVAPRSCGECAVPTSCVPAFAGEASERVRSGTRRAASRASERTSASAAALGARGVDILQTIDARERWCHLARRLAERRHTLSLSPQPLARCRAARAHRQCAAQSGSRSRAGALPASWA